MADGDPTEAEVAAKARADADAATAKATADAEAAAKAKEQKFSQEDLDRIAGTTRAQARSAAEKELLEALGITDVDAAKAALKAAADAEEANKTELQKAQDRATAAEAKEVLAQARADAVAIAADLKGSLRDAGINPDRLDAALRLVDLADLKVEGTTVSGVAEAVTKLKESTPEWFGTMKRTAADATGGGGGPIDYRTASSEDLRKAAAAHGVRI